jgi:ABC-2 type transport system ATP-binding protein
MTPVVRAVGLTKHYRSRPALTDVTLDIPAGRVVGLVGPNGAGKSTLLNLAAGIIAPTSGTIEVLGAQPGSTGGSLSQVGFVAQDTPIYANLSVDDHLRMGAHLNSGWDAALARSRLTEVGLDPAQKAGRLSGGQRAQLALTIAAAKRPRLLMFDEPVASLDPLARRAFLQSLMQFVAELEVTVILSSHLIGDLERVCDHLVILTASRVQLAGDVDPLLASVHRLVGARDALTSLPAAVEVIHAEHTGRQSTLIVHDPTGALAGVAADVQRLTLEDLVLAYLTRAAAITAGVASPVEARR